MDGIRPRYSYVCNSFVNCNKLVFLLPVQLFVSCKFIVIFHVSGNIALHIFSDKARLTYDLETLWSVGPEYDEKTNKKSEVVDIFENYSAYLKDLKPLS